MGVETVTYICRHMMQVLSAETGEVEWRYPGDEVPEAATWPGLAHYLHRGAIEEAQPAHSTYPPLPDVIVENVDKDSSAGERRAAKRRALQEAHDAEVALLRARVEELATPAPGPALEGGEAE